MMRRPDLERVTALVLRKQHLTPGSRSDDLVQIVKDIAGLHATSSTTPFLSLFARMPGFTKALLEEELYLKRTLARIRCVRKTIFIHPIEMLPTLHSATREQIVRASKRFMAARGVREEDYHILKPRILELLNEEALTTSEIKSKLDAPVDVPSVLYYMCDLGLLLRDKPPGGWKGKSISYKAFDKVFPHIDLSGLSEAEASTALIRSYLAAFGPVLEEDVFWWTGLGKRKVRKALEALKPEVFSTSVDGLEGDFFLLKSDESALLDSEQPSGPIIHFLPVLDPYPMGYKRRERYLRPQDEPWIFDRSGNITSTLFLNGEVVGVWDFEEGREPKIKVHPRRDLPTELWSQVLCEAQRVGRFLAEQEVIVEECDTMIPLTRRTAGAMMSPLKDAKGVPFRAQ